MNTAELIPKISIITPTYNAALTLEEALRSVAEQTYTQIEHIIIDGGSADNTVELIKRYADKYSHIRWISEPDRGVYDAMNKGIDMATGKWLYFLGSDDKLIHNNILSEIFSDKKNQRYDVIYGSVFFIKSQREYDGKFSRFKFLRRNICHQAIFTKREVFDQLGKFNIEYISFADYEFNMRWFDNSSIKKRYIAKTIAHYTQGGFSHQNTDYLFEENREKLVDQYYPLGARILFRNQDKKIARVILNRIIQFEDQKKQKHLFQFYLSDFKRLFQIQYKKLTQRLLKQVS